jgi:putative glutamine amidotransferase
VALGGTLTRQAGAAMPHHAADDVPFMAMFDFRHEVALVPGGVLARAHGASGLTVNSVHYQGIARLAPGLAVEATAPDGMVEAVRATDGGPPLLAVQWHPEWDADAAPQSATFFHLLGRALRRQPLLPEGAA